MDRSRLETPTIDDVRDAARRISGHATRTPLLTFPKLDEITGARVFLKPECLQRTGSFKFRGAFNAVSRLAEAGARSVVACSSGNHAQGVAEAARLLGLKATIAMPQDAPAIKRARTEASGAEVVEYDRTRDDRDVVAEALADRIGAPIVHPFNDFYVIAGQGSAGLEAGEDLAALGVVPDVALICCGGGGLTAGVSLAISNMFPSTTIHTVEPAGFDDYARSLASGARLMNERRSGSICDALLSNRPGELGFAICRDRVQSGLVVSDDEVLAAIGFAARELKLVLEPGGAVALAALLAGKADIAGKTVLVLLSGGNVDPAILAVAIGAGPNPTQQAVSRRA